MLEQGLRWSTFCDFENKGIGKWLDYIDIVFDKVINGFRKK